MANQSKQIFTAPYVVSESQAHNAGSQIINGLQ